MPGLIGKKIGMTSVYNAGKNIPCTVIEAGPCVVTQVKTKEKMGMKLFNWLMGKKEKKLHQSAMKGHFKKKQPQRKDWQNLRDMDKYKVGDEVKVDFLKKENG